ncbi:Cro/CI family transcriptional regulator [Acinetobacter larvae]|uniref:HTH cro/C1-type domain-containing protein n=1 Tax=Acinetobacter larvae TaxID=1789224 RepID=A0A1B2LZ68_9GAMM|nr:Cro/CI family transcriptional regulator [Acinetobacter larvae]AOA58252.1 hypothetical protein BFG52_07720 [Acinetobacter larvae]
MTVEQLMAFYEAKNKSHLANIIGVARSTVTAWEQNGIPPRTQATFEVLTKGKLKADLQTLIA